MRLVAIYLNDCACPLIIPDSNHRDLRGRTPCLVQFAMARVCVVGALAGLLIAGRHEQAEEPENAPEVDPAPVA